MVMEETDGALDCNGLRGECEDANNPFKKFSCKEKGEFGAKLEKRQAFSRRGGVKPISLSLEGLEARRIQAHHPVRGRRCFWDAEGSSWVAEVGNKWAWRVLLSGSQAPYYHLSLFPPRIGAGH